MNKLILIGNGFDLAHGLKTSYNDFMIWYVKKCFTHAFDNQFYNDKLIQIEVNNQYNGNLVDQNGVIAYIEESYKQSFAGLGINVPIKGNAYSAQFPFYTTPNGLMKVLLENCSNTCWVQIETEFYDLLKAILKENAGYSYKEECLSVLNQSLKFLIDKLQEYLAQLPIPHYDDRYGQIFCSPLKKFDVLLPWSEGPQWRSEERYKINRTSVLNFNYTRTASLYMKDIDTLYTDEFIDIHGQLNNDLNPIIFGFGDELDDDYLKMERERAKGYFDHIKSFWYFRNSNYGNLIRFIDSDEYIIYVLGHSCGISDRTMLHMIFEHPNCKSIKIFYHGDKTTNNYTEITYEIARHFNDKELMRRRIIPRDRSMRMPQFADLCSPAIDIIT